MWFRLSEEVALPASAVVGFFAPDAVPGTAAEGAAGVAGEGTPRAVVVLADGRALASRFTLRTLAGRFNRGRI